MILVDLFHILLTYGSLWYGTIQQAYNIGPIRTTPQNHISHRNHVRIRPPYKRERSSFSSFRR